MSVAVYSPLIREQVNLPLAKKQRVGVPGQIGLLNLGNTCYMNAILQVLSHTETLRSAFLSMLDPKVEQFRASAALVPLLPRITRKKSREDPPCQAVWVLSSAPYVVYTNKQPHSSLVAEMRDLFRDLWFRDAVTLSASSFQTSMWSVIPRFYGSEQQDAHEFLRALLEQLHTEFKTSRSKKERTTIQDIFQGILLSRITCQNCGASSRNTEPFLDLSIDIPQSTKEVVLQDCIRSFMSEETLEAHWPQCHKCDAKEGVRKQFSLKSTPRVLCLHIKRFRWEPAGRTKIASLLEIPLELDLSEYCTYQRGSTKFELYGIVSHKGSRYFPVTPPMHPLTPL